MNNVTAIIKTFLRDEYLYRCISSLKASYPDIKVFVADDGRFSEEKDQKLKELGVDLYLKLPFNSGITYGRNRLCDELKTDYFLLGDDDFIYDGRANLEKMLTLMDIADVVGGAITANGQIQHYEGFFTRSDDDGLIYKVLDLNVHEYYKQIPYKPCELTFNFLMAKKSVIDRARWDEFYKITYEHSDFFLTMKEAGIRVIYTPACVVQHKSPDIQNTEEYNKYRYDISVTRDYFLKKRGFKYLIDMTGTRAGLQQ